MSESIFLKYPPKTFVDKSLSSTFGMCEMEMAVKVIINRCAKAGYWVGHETYFGLEDFPDRDLRIGFLNLLLHGWFRDSFITNDIFILSAALVQRLAQKLTTDDVSMYDGVDEPDADGPEGNEPAPDCSVCREEEAGIYSPDEPEDEAHIDYYNHLKDA